MAFGTGDLKALNPLKATANAQEIILGAAVGTVLVPYVKKFVLDKLKDAAGKSYLPEAVQNHIGAITVLLAGAAAYFGLSRTKWKSKAGGVYVGAAAVAASSVVAKLLEGAKLPGLSYGDTVAVQLGTLIDERPPALGAYQGLLVDEPGYRNYAQDDDDGMGQLSALAMDPDEDYADLDALVNIEA